jgi:pyrophosphatase PpaX
LTAYGGWKGVFFDLDGTLADTVGLILMSYRHTMRTHLGEAPPDERWLATMGTPLRDQLGAFARDPDEAAAMIATYTQYQRDIHDDMAKPFPGAAEVLAELRRRGSCLAVVTSKRGEVARKTLQVCGLTDAIDLVVTAEDVRHGKPDPESVLLALAQLDLKSSPAEVLFVGDAPFDLRAGRAAGTRTAAAPWGAFARSALAAEAPDYMLERLTDVLDLDPVAGSVTRPVT